MKKVKEPDYKKIYSDIVRMNFPSKMEICEEILSKHSLSRLEVITIDKILFGECINNSKHRSYNKKTIFEILDYQKKNNLNNVQLAKHFKISRNTVTKWKKMFI